MFDFRNKLFLPYNSLGAGAILFLKGRSQSRRKLGGSATLVTTANSLIGDHLVDIVDVDEVVKGSDMPRRVRHVCLGSIAMDSS